tara:strand:+ start:68 stop:1822 length:1755 start_codon:yes stop_codon:yes gene_type:complete
MKISKLLNKRYLSIILIFFFIEISSQSEEPVDIWNLEKKIEENIIIENQKKEKISQNSIYEMQSEKNKKTNILQDQTLISKEIKIAGIYDPVENGLDINMWSNSNGDEILNIYKRINKIDLSQDASEILNILLLTNAYYPKKNISKKEFLEIKSSWLIKSSNLELIENYLLNNQIVNENPKLARYLVDEYLTNSKVEKSCKIFSKIKEIIEDEYLSKFEIYCLVNSDKKDEAQLLLDLKKELGFKNKFYEKKINYLMGFDDKPEVTISEKSILDFHLSHQTNPDFKFIPKNDTSKKIWKYLSTSNLLYNIEDVELTDLEKISTIEKATHEKNYAEQKLFKLYERFQFNINQLLNISEASRGLSSIETRALIYQGILITSDIETKFELLNALKNSFEKDNIENAFSQQLKFFLNKVKKDEVPDNYKLFYERNIDDEEIKLTNVKINNKILHQSKLINYLIKDISIKNITKDLDDLLKKIKRDKKYFFSKKDVILVEALKSDGVKVSEKYKNLYEINESDIPSDIQTFINNEDMAAAMLRIVEVIGEDDLKNIDADTMYFIISTLNQLNIDLLRNRILLKVLPLKV